MDCSAVWRWSGGDGAVAGVDVCAPVGAEAVGAEAAGELAEHQRWADFPLAGVVGRRHVRVFEEDEELRPPRLDRGLQFAAGRVCRGQSDERVEAAPGAGVIVTQRRRLQRLSALSDADRPAQQVAQPRREDRIAAVDGVRDVAQDVAQDGGEADLMRRRQILLAGVAVGDPDRWPVRAQAPLRRPPSPGAARSCAAPPWPRRTASASRWCRRCGWWSRPRRSPGRPAASP